ncbi:unnamed protein product [marine sediment metagenome]|uniref:Uncharacterized protein n=1 Tax=marine sediment metagenome TaxID=412755 RepID=X1AUM7_9ZZZZ
MTRVYHEKILEAIEEGGFTTHTVLFELLSFLPEDTLKSFYYGAFGNVGFEGEDY